MLRLVRWLGWRFLVVAAVLVWAIVGGPLPAPVMWLLSAYVLFRAFPGIRADVSRLLPNGGRRISVRGHRQGLL